MRQIYMYFVVFFLLISCGVVNSDPEVSPNLQEETKKIEEKINNLKALKKQAEELEKKNICINIDEVKINILNYNNIKVDWFIDTTLINNIEQNNNINLQEFEAQIKLLEKYNKDKKIYLALFNELEFYENNWCFPNKNIVLLVSNNSKVNFYTDIFLLLKKYDVKFNIALNTINVRKTWRYEDFMTAGELNEIIWNKNFEFLSNSVTWINLAIIDNENKLKHEICSSKNYLETNFNSKVNTIFYPYWVYNDDIIELAKSCWYLYWISNLENNNTENKDEKNWLIGDYRYKLESYNIDKKFNLNTLFDNR